MPTSRERILESARDAFVERGLIGASIGDVSAAASASVGAVYHHFDGKEEAAGAVFRAALRRLHRNCADAVTPSADAETGITIGVRAVLRWCLRDDPEAARFLLTAA